MEQSAQIVEHRFNDRNVQFVRFMTQCVWDPLWHGCQSQQRLRRCTFCPLGLLGCCWWCCCVAVLLIMTQMTSFVSTTRTSASLLLLLHFSFLTLSTSSVTFLASCDSVEESLLVLDLDPMERGVVLVLIVNGDDDDTNTDDNNEK